ncbi:ABC transporter ATP-binding protein [Photobacterium sp. S4TG1]|uniref:ABC transporter ATP-binding protein n=1 Tax=Photobacterium sp. S4TG1 TaxID=3114587 RepID=UPI002E17ED2D|nr:ABC transporter ATP-binding protein [Photobacterium sp. S4TG1]
MYSKNIIEVKKISKYYPVFESPVRRLKQVILGKSIVEETDFCALNQVDFAVKKGEVVAILGSNGSGKSTLLQMICGTLNPSKGSIKTSGRIAALLELGAGFNLEYTGRENIVLNASILGLSEKEIFDRMDDIISFSELKEYIDQPVKSYSSGMFVRLAFSVAVNVYPDILIVDEALSVGDAKFQAKCINKIQEIIGNGTTLLFVSHDVTAVRTICNRAIWLNKGSMIMDGDVFDVSSKYMEYMLDDDNRDINSFINDEINKTSLNEKRSDNTDINDLPTKDDQKNLSLNAAAHWGKNKGCIKRVKILDKELNDKKYFDKDEIIKFSVDYKLPIELKNNSTSVAFSIKNMKGVDLIVGVSEIIPIESENTLLNTTFTLKNELVPNDYILVIALEDTSSSEPCYYEYIEGAAYFKTGSKNKLHGIFNPQIDIITKVIVDEYK